MAREQEAKESPKAAVVISTEVPAGVGSMKNEEPDVAK